VTHPPELFYNDPKSHSFDVVLALRRHDDGKIAERDWKRVEIQLLYERGELVDDQSILEFIDNPGRMKLNESTAFRFRINQVSRNHLNRRFKLRFRLQEDSSIEVHTSAVMVLSKEASKRSRGKRNKDGNAAPAKRTKKVNDAQSEQWITQACDIFKGIAWQRVGYEFVTDTRTGEEKQDKSSPIFKCVCCGAMAGRQQVCDASGIFHRDFCTLNKLLTAQKQACMPPLQPVNKTEKENLEDLLQNVDVPDGSTMAADLQDILQIPAESFNWLQQDLAQHDELLSDYNSENGSDRTTHIRLPLLAALAGVCQERQLECCLERGSQDSNSLGSRQPNPVSRFKSIPPSLWHLFMLLRIARLEQSKICRSHGDAIGSARRKLLLQCLCTRAARALGLAAGAG